MPRKGLFKMTKQKAQAARLMAEGKTLDQVALICFDDVRTADGTTTDNKKLLDRKRTIRKWQQEPLFQEAYRDVLRAEMFPTYGRAADRISKQIDDPNPWVAQNAAREVLTRYAPVVVGAEEKAVTVRVEGMPVLGAPALDDGAQDTAQGTNDE